MVFLCVSCRCFARCCASRTTAIPATFLSPKPYECIMITQNHDIGIACVAARIMGLPPGSFSNTRTGEDERWKGFYVVEVTIRQPPSHPTACLIGSIYLHPSLVVKNADERVGGQQRACRSVERGNEVHPLAYLAHGRWSFGLVG